MKKRLFVLAFAFTLSVTMVFAGLSVAQKASIKRTLGPLITPQKICALYCSDYTGEAWYACVDGCVFGITLGQD